MKCKIPKGLDVEDGTGKGAYDFWLYIDGYGYNYLSRDYFEEKLVATFYNVGLQSKYPTDEGATPASVATTSRAGDNIVTKMQEMSNGICNNRS